MFIPNLEDIAFEIINRKLSGDKKKDEEDTLFADSLFDLTARNSENISEDVPDTWHTGGVWDVLGSVTAAKDYLQKHGVDTENRVPTHSINQEQRDWLAARHDLEAINSLSVNSPEFGDLMADLYYLNIISESEALATARVDAVPNGELMYQNDIASLYKLLSENEKDADDERADTILKYLDKLIEIERERLEEKQEQYYLDFIHGKTDRDLLDSLMSDRMLISQLLFG